MLRRCCAISLALFVPLQSWGQTISDPTLREELYRPYVSLLAADTLDDDVREQLKFLQAELEQDRDRRNEEFEDEEERLQEDLDAAREELKTLNESSSQDSRPMTEARSSLHSDIGALEQILRDRKNEQERTAAAAEIKLAKLYLLDHWPDRRNEVARRIDEGSARERNHGDFEDIGYRKLIEDPDGEIPMGEQAIRQMISSGLMPIPVQDPAVQEYVRSLARRIASNSDLKVPLYVTVLDDPDINVTGLPGGFLLLSSGLVLAAETESQLAGVIARQIAVIAAGHASRASRRSVVSKIFMPVVRVAASVLTGGITNAGAYYGVSYGLDSLSVLVDRTLTGANEKYQKEADQLGIQYAWKAGFDPTGSIGFIDSLASGRHPDAYRFLGPGPILAERLLDAFTEIQYLPARENSIVDSEDFQEAQRRLEQVRIIRESARP